MTITNGSAAGDSTAPRARGREYVTPVLKVYGDVAAVTHNIDMTGAKDGGPGSART
ncbi:MAG: hypothetical protein ABIQ52_15730 [Vicinamibacterales bacterium]